jgi:G:T-mismatch repair DNA endonuclease (very short patch repair protein)
MWLLHMEQADGCRTMHARNGREYRPPELPKYIVDGYCPETKIIYEFLGCFYHGHTCQMFRDVKTMCGDTLSERYERTLARIEQITQAGYQVKIQWECHFDEAGIEIQKPELLTHPIVEQSPLHTCDALYGGRTEAMRLHYKSLRDRDHIICRIYEFVSVHPQKQQVPNRASDHSRRGRV